MNILKDYWNSPLNCIVSIFDISCNYINVTKKQIIYIYIYMHSPKITWTFHKWKNKKGCNSKENEQPIFTKHHIQPIKMEHQAKINEHEHKSIYIDIYNKTIQGVPINSCICCEKLFFKNKLNINCYNNFLNIFKFE